MSKPQANNTNSNANASTDPRLGSQPAFSRANKKYRPSLTAEQIEHILYLAKTVGILSSKEFSLISTLAPFQAKIENNTIAPAYINAPARPKANSLEALGAGTPLGHSSDMPKEEYWEKCYLKFNTDVMTCSLAEIEAANEYRYINDLMSAEEERAHESQGSKI